MSHLISYSPHLDEFVKVKKITEEELDKFFLSINKLILKPNFGVRKFIKEMNKFLLPDYVKLTEKFDTVDNVDEMLYECILEIYENVTIDSACNKFNSKEDSSVSSKASSDAVKLSLSELLNVEKQIKKNLIGQDPAVEKAIRAMKLQSSGFEPFLSLFFIGPTGVGKTELSRLLADKYLGDKNRLLKINCAEYANPHEYAKLIGSPPGYIGFGEKGILSEKAEEGSQWIILFDEIEKASEKLKNLLLGLLDEGTITDNRGSELDFSNSIIIFTSNVGMHDNIGNLNVGFGAEESTYESSMGDIKESFKKEFSPEFINRIDEVVYFNQLNKKDAAKIARLSLKKLPLRVTPSLVKYTVDNSFSTEYGARNIKRFIKNNVTIKIADIMLANTDRYNKFKPIIHNGDLEIQGLE